MNVLTNTSCRVVKGGVKRLQSLSMTVSSLDIKIPNRIERKPTDILKALEKTISKDPSAWHYKYHDDPYLIPLSKMEQRINALALESGRKAAMWVYKEHEDLFARELSNPLIPEFLPPVVYTRKDQVSEEILLNTISQGKTLEALKIYNLLDENLSTKAKQSLLELLCFSNSKDLLQFTFQEEQWFKLNIMQKIKRVWVETEEIKKLFDFLISQDSETAAAAYNALICGRAKFFETDQAWSLYSQCVLEKVPLNVYAYNAIIRILPLLAKARQPPTVEVFKLLKEMSKNGVCPNVGTLNAALETVHLFTSSKTSIDFIYDLLGEFKVAGVKPSLTTYCHILLATKRDSDLVVSTLNDILSTLEKETLQLLDPNDVKFFPIAIDIAKDQCNRGIGERVHALFLKDDNYRFINTSYSESIYYRDYLLLNLKTLPIEEFFTLYYSITMNTYIPDSVVIAEIFETLPLHNSDIASKHLPKLWSHVQSFHFFDVDKVIKCALHVTGSCILEAESPLHETFAQYALNIWHFKQSKPSTIRRTLWDVQILANIILLLLRASWYDDALQVVSFMVHAEGSVMGVLDIKEVDKLLEICLLNGYGPIALDLIKYATISGQQDAAVMARKVYNVIPLSPAEKQKLISLVGNDVLQLQLSHER